MSAEHSHSHSHHHHHHHDFAAANQALFDKHAHEADQRPDAAEVAAKIAEAILKAYPFDRDNTLVLDYACGTGIVARSIVPHCKTYIGVDISQGMVDQFTKGAEAHGIPTEKMRAIRTELKGEDHELDGIKFDVVMCSLAYHHIGDILSVTRLLAFFLKPVNFPDADISFRSNDQVVFRVHIKNLETHSDGFPPAAFCASGSTASVSEEVVDLSESAAVLDLLFQYVYPQRQPDLSEIELPLLADLSEAVEKYQVYAAMDICKIFMGNGLQDNPLTVLNYAVRHGYSDIADEAAPLTVSLPLDEVGTHMYSTYVGAWLKYYAEWQKILEVASAEGWRIGHTSPCRISNSSTCPHWLTARQHVLTKLGARPGALNDLAMIFTTAHGLYPCAIESLRQWEYFIVVKVKDIPKFRNFL
ncbi:S-adenosyl-L-methionine-dependent methyltransferase [Favolaschia claudopus]|uniref:S-adenosyl-L-methionine-dependent methyltransferase n=1 Tax=Favolaschia claudopus TaxID=2862362 RepID=A0AAW0C9Z3_9AGAR